MGRLTDITLEELRELHKRTDGETPRERILAAIGRKQGDQIDTLAERHSVAEKTIRNWLDRFAEQPLEQTPYDEDRPGRPPKLSDDGAGIRSVRVRCSRYRVHRRTSPY